MNSGSVALVAEGRSVRVERMVACIVLICLAASCRNAPTTESGEENVNGVVVEYEWIMGDTPTIRKDSESFELSYSNISLKVIDKNIGLNRIKYGQVKDGDRIRVTADGKLFVNGLRRKPVYAGF